MDVFYIIECGWNNLVGYLIEVFSCCIFLIKCCVVIRNKYKVN